MVALLGTRGVGGVYEPPDAAARPSIREIVPFTALALIAVSVAAYWLQVNAGWVFSTFGLSETAIAGGELYRALSYGFLHLNEAHIAGNMLGLLIAGAVLEKAIGPRRFLAVYLVSLAGAAAMALLLVSLEPATGGASGGVYGVLAAAAALALKMVLSLGSPETRKEAWARLVWALVGALMLVYMAAGFWERLDSAGTTAFHAGGAIAGLLCMVIVLEGSGGALGRGLRRTGDQVYAMASLGLLLVSASVVLAH